MNSTLKSLFSGVIFSLGMAVPIMAAPIEYTNIGKVAPEHTFQATITGNITAYFYGTTANFNEQLGLFVNGTQRGDWGLLNHGSNFGDSIDFGLVQAHDILTFALRVFDTNYTLYSGPAINNPDRINHTFSTAFPGETRGDVTIPAGTFVGFEDSLRPFSDLNYNDEAFVFTDTTPSQVPEPSSLLLAFGGLSLITGRVAQRWKR